MKLISGRRWIWAPSTVVATVGCAAFALSTPTTGRFTGEARARSKPFQLKLVVEHGSSEWFKPVDSGVLPPALFSIVVECDGHDAVCAGYAIEAPPTGVPELDDITVVRREANVVDLSARYLVSCPGQQPEHVDPSVQSVTIRTHPGGAVLEGCGEPVRMIDWEGPKEWRSRAMAELARNVATKVGLELPDCRPFAVSCATDRIGLACRSASTGWVMIWPDGTDFRLRKLSADEFGDKCASDALFVPGWEP